MPETFSRRLETIAPALVSALTWLAALALTAWFGANWYWRITAPRPTAHPQTVMVEPSAASRDVISRHLFGEVAAPPVGGPNPNMPQSRLSLIGIAAHSGVSPGFVVLQEEGKPAQGFVLGEEVSPGVKLVKILPGSVELEHGGTRETLRLPENVNNHTAPTGGAMMPNSTPQAFTGAQPAPNWTPPVAPQNVPMQQMQQGLPQQNGAPSGVVMPPPQNVANPVNFENRPPQ